MKSIAATLFFLAFYIRLSGACIYFYSNVSNARDFTGSGSLMDDGVRVCTWNGKLGKTEQYWLDCNEGHSAFVTKEFHTLAYSKGGQNFRIPLAFERVNEEVELIYGNGESCQCDAKHYCK
ncbi:hypothetical protein VE00_04182 [Pseudogymnoascus sp. WSF 3629]|jgi:hypothetical protein|nr:hypothetical protein VE00_04182 [Pseudogymnoascus sp. WSF 3629]